MRRAVATGIVMTALVSGCGGGSDRSGDRPGASGSQGPAATATQLAPDGRLGPAVVARPGNTEVSGRGRRITGGSILPPPSARRALGAEAGCADAELEPTAENLAQVSAVVFCLMNAMRENAGMPRLREQEQLTRASTAHSQDMVEKKYFAHDSQDGRDLVARLTAGGYIVEDQQWVVGENLAWGSGALATPRALVNAWMNSPPHRANLLSADFQEVGLGLVLGTPRPEAEDGVTVTTDFGTRVAAAPARQQVAGRPVSSRRRSTARRCARKKGAAKRRCLRAGRRLR